MCGVYLLDMCAFLFIFLPFFVLVPMLVLTHSEHQSVLVAVTTYLCHSTCTSRFSSGVTPLARLVTLVSRQAEKREVRAAQSLHVGANLPVFLVQYAPVIFFSIHLNAWQFGRAIWYSVEQCFVPSRKCVLTTHRPL